jgi:hypothetical protein
VEADNPFNFSICHLQWSQELRSLGTLADCSNFLQGFQLNLDEILRNWKGKSHPSDAIQDSKDLSMHVHEFPEKNTKKLLYQVVPARV